MNDVRDFKPKAVTDGLTGGTFVDSSITYNESGFTYNQTGQVYGGTDAKASISAFFKGILNMIPQGVIRK